MSTEYAVLDQDGNQMGMPARSWPSVDMAVALKRTLEQARARAIGEGQAAETILSSGEELKVHQTESLEDSVTKGKRAAAVSYGVYAREVGQWRKI